MAHEKNLTRGPAETQAQSESASLPLVPRSETRPYVLEEGPDEEKRPGRFVQRAGRPTLLVQAFHVRPDWNEGCKILLFLGRSIRPHGAASGRARHRRVVAISLRHAVPCRNTLALEAFIKNARIGLELRLVLFGVRLRRTNTDFKFQQHGFCGSFRPDEIKSAPRSIISGSAHHVWRRGGNRAISVFYRHEAAQSLSHFHPQHFKHLYLGFAFARGPRLRTRPPTTSPRPDVRSVGGPATKNLVLLNPMALICFCATSN